mgnify:CR=1 FL=1
MFEHWQVFENRRATVRLTQLRIANEKNILEQLQKLKEYEKKEEEIQYRESQLSKQSLKILV